MEQCEISLLIFRVLILKELKFYHINSQFFEVGGKIIIS